MLIARAWTASATLAACAAVLARTLFDRPGAVGLLVQSDSLLPAAFIRDLLTHPALAGRFQHPRVPSFLPDTLVYGVIQGLTGDWRWAVLGFALASFLGFVGIGSAIVAGAREIRWSTAVLVLAPVTLALLEAGWWETEYNRPASAVISLLSPVSHGGPFVLSLLVLPLGFRALHPARPGRLAALAAVAFCLGQGDLLVFAPALAALAVVAAFELRVGSVPLGAVARVMATMCLAGFAGARSARLIVMEPAIPLSFERVLANAAHFFAAVPTQPFAALSVAGTLLACAGAMLTIARPPRGSAGAIWRYGAVDAAGSLAALALLYEDPGSLRYATGAIWWPVLLATMLVVPAVARIPAWVTGIAATAALLAFLLPAGPRRPALLAWRAPIERCLHNAPETRDLRAGLADYWDARAISASSNWRLQVDQITPAGQARLWGNNPEWFRRSMFDGQTRPDYRFIVMRGLEPDSVAAIYGAPARKLACPGSEVWLYPESAGIDDRLIAATPFLADDALRSPLGATVAGDDLRPRWTRFPPAGGHLETGPWIAVPAGRWRVSVTYRLQAEATWRVTAKPNLTTLAEGALPAAEEPRTATLLLDLAREARSVGISVASGQAAELSIERVTIAREP